MKKIQDFILQGKEIFVGLENSKKTWKVCVRRGRMVVHEASLPTVDENLRNYFRNKFPNRTCHVPDRQLREDWQISRLYGQLQRDITRGCNRSGEQEYRYVRFCLRSDSIRSLFLLRRRGRRYHADNAHQYYSERLK